MPSITITWHALPDACPICAALQGHQWTFTTPEPLPTELIANGQIVWNLNEGSKAHGHKRYNCRCNIEMSEPDLSDVNAWVERKLRELEETQT